MNISGEMESRPLANFSPSIWGCTFASLPSATTEMEQYSRQVEDLEAAVNEKLAAAKMDTFQNVELVNLLERLGASYRFQQQIEDQLLLTYEEAIRRLNLSNDNDDDDDGYDLYTVSLVFRILRQHGYRVPCDVFKKFKDLSTGELKECLKGDVRGILSLYEASHLRLQGEDILEEALSFSTSILVKLLEDDDDDDVDSLLSVKIRPHLIEHIKNALICPFHKSARRIDARRYISFYAEEEGRDETLLRFAKLDFNFLQLMHREELALVSRWWRDTGLREEVQHARDRIVELYFWAMGSRFEPQYGLARIAATKYAKMVSLVDDTYDAYATPAELRLFTAAFQRCDISAVGQLPENLRELFRAFLKLCDETEDDMKMQGRCFSALHAKEAFKELVRAYAVEAGWLEEGYIPTMKEFLKNGIPSSSYGVISAAYFTGMREVMGIMEYEWLKTNPTIDTATKLLGRLLNDIMSHEDEQKRGHCPSAVECYKRENGVCDEEAVEAIRKMCDEAWKQMNEQLMMRSSSASSVGMPVLQHFLDLVRIITFIYIRTDSYTHPMSLKDHIICILLDPIPL